MKQFLIFLQLIFYIIIQVYSFSFGVPPSPKVCKNMMPGHKNYTSQLSKSPFEIYIEPMSLVGGDIATVTLKSTSELKFKGFYIQGRGVKGTPIGTFQTNEFTNAHSCGGVRWNAAHHANGNELKDIVMIKWEVPNEYEGEVNFIGTFVANYATIWTGIQADPITVAMRNLSQSQQPTQRSIGSRFLQRSLNITSSLFSAGPMFLRNIFQQSRLRRIFTNNSTRLN